MIIAPLSIVMIFDCLAHSIVACKCKARSFKPVPVSPNDKWQLISLYQLKRTRHYKELSMKRASIDNCQALVDASQSKYATAYALGIIKTESLYIASECLQCTVDRLRLDVSRGRAASSVIVIPCWGTEVKEL